METTKKKEDRYAVEVVALGYRWHCPECHSTNLEETVYDEVTCPKCGMTYNVGRVSQND